MQRNKGRTVYSDPNLDYILGEVFFDGKVWHLLVLGVLAVLCIGMGLALSMSASTTSPNANTKTVGGGGKESKKKQ